ncbi:MAG: signal peptidase II [Sphingomonadaceae bacterium]
MTPTARNRLTGLALAMLVFIADQVSKWWVTGPLGLVNENDQIVLTGFFNLTRTSNYGVSMGFLTADSIEMRWGLVAMTAAIALVVFVWMLREKVLGEILPLGLILGGALGNILDRYKLGHVVDFADFHLGAWHFYIFNLADAAISIGVVIILARSFLIREKQATDAGLPATET